MDLNRNAAVMAVLVLSLFVFPVGSTGEFPITTNISNQRFPSIHRDFVV